MVFPVPAIAVGVWVSRLLSGFSDAGTALTIGIFVTAVFLATRCKGCCREDSIFRSHVM
jgi:hypothetical protein